MAKGAALENVEHKGLREHNDVQTALKLLEDAHVHPVGLSENEVVARGIYDTGKLIGGSAMAMHFGAKREALTGLESALTRVNTGLRHAVALDFEGLPAGQALTSRLEATEARIAQQASTRGALKGLATFAAAWGANLLVDRTFFNDVPLRGATLAADFLVAPALCAAPIRWPIAGLAIVATHAAARYIDSKYHPQGLR